MLEFLKSIFEDKSLSYEEFCSLIKENKELNLVNFKKDEWVSKDEFDRKELELTSIKGQLDNANKEIKSYKDLDIEGIKKAAKEWEEKYNLDTKELKSKLARQEYEFKAKEYLNGFNFINDRMKKSVMDEFLAQDFKLDGSTFLGANDWMSKLKEDEPTIFVQDEEEKEDPIIITKNINFNDKKNKVSLSELMKKANLKQ